MKMLPHPAGGDGRGWCRSRLRSRRGVEGGAAEGCTDAGKDCHALVDDADPGVSGTSRWYINTDREGDGDVANTQRHTTPRGRAPLQGPLADGPACARPELRPAALP
ncbi:MAG TPA: hypothetical protein PKY30_05675 [Myxococcota bacterium]|nr:hypothetical protein [Myxococcota bacterium]HNH46503.1 hypothetical protein [Myxococcota bacterium]